MVDALDLSAEFCRAFVTKHEPFDPAAPMMDLVGQKRYLAQ